MPRMCNARLESGRICGNRGIPGRHFCSAHLPEGRSAFRPCRYFNRFGRPCQGQAIRGQDHCFTHSPRNRHAKAEPIPLVPRTRRQMQRGRWLIISNLALSQTTALQPARTQPVGTVPLYPGAGFPVTAK